jgi:hypothetical protein
MMPVNTGAHIVCNIKVEAALNVTRPPATSAAPIVLSGGGAPSVLSTTSSGRTPAPQAGPGPIGNIRTPAPQAYPDSFYAPETPVYEDLSSDWIEISIRLGRTDPDSSFDTGSMTVRLENDDMLWHPNNSLSPHYANLIPNRRVRVRFDTTVLADQWTDQWKPEDTFPGKSVTALQCRDAFKLLSGYAPAALVTPEANGQNVAGLLSKIALRSALPAWMIDAQTGTIYSTMQEQTLSGDQLTQAKLFADSDIGFLWAEPSTGKITYRPRDWRRTSPRSTVVQWRFVDSPSGAANETMAYFQLQDVNDARLRLFSELAGSRRNGTVQVASRSDLTFIGLQSGMRRGGPIQADGRRDLECESDAQVVAVLNERIGRLVPTLDCFQKVTIKPSVHQKALDAVLALKIHDRVFCSGHIPNARRLGIPPVAGDHFIEGIEHRISGTGEWEVDYWLSPTFLSAQTTSDCACVIPYDAEFPTATCGTSSSGCSCFVVMV